MPAPGPRHSRTAVPLLIAAVVVVMLIAVTLLMRSRSSAPEVVVSPPAADAVDGTRAPPTATSGDVSANRPRLSQQDSQALALRAVERRREARKDSSKRADMLKTKVAQQFDSEKVDPAWAPGKEVDLEKISSLPQITSSVAAPKSMTVDCRSSMCRINSAFDSNGNAEDWITVYMASVGSALPNAVVSRVPNADGTTTVQIYGRGR